ncbi:MAG: Orange carotenoid protein, partial [Cyanobacteria bacterium]|nr:Orange carotenoid protein [Cyanobacteriota bacterium]MDW8202852.1 orange carotenoid protein N-terminal domain-containing protein [Cyanobacteriota bacterium SKYGB_h_bin112]
MGFNLSRFSSAHVVARDVLGVASGAVSVVAQFQRLCADDQMDVFWHIYTDLSYLVMPAAPSSSRSQQVEGLLQQVQAMAHVEQLQAVRTLFTKGDSLISRAYGALSPTTKLAFWYHLANLMA